MKDLALIKCAGLWSNIKNVKVDPKFFDSTAELKRKAPTGLEAANAKETALVRAVAGDPAKRDFSTAAGRYAAAPDWMYDNPLTRKSRERHTIPLLLANMGGKALFGKSLAPSMGPVLKPLLANSEAKAVPLARRLNFKDYVSHSIGRRYDPHGIN